MSLTEHPGSLGASVRIEAAPVFASGVTSESDLVERSQAGDRDAFALLIERRLDPSFRTALAILGDEADARDATQDTFLRAWTELPRLRDIGRFDAWLDRILVNRCRTLWSRRRRTRIREIHLSDLPIPAEPATAGDPTWDDGPVSLDAVERAFERLSIDERTILVLHHLQRLPLSTIAATLGIPVGTAKSRLYAARQALERALEVELR